MDPVMIRRLMLGSGTAGMPCKGNRLSLNLLTEPLIRFDASGKRTMASLPDVYAALMDDNVIAFPALRSHQRHAWHAFLVQVGALAMSRVRLDMPPTRAAEWACLNVA